MKTASTRQFHYVGESESDFLALFPHRFDYIYAHSPEPGQTPAWQTESRHPLSDRLIQQGSYLYGVRFGAQTDYCLLDIDSGSFYHPDRDPLAIGRILAVLEAIGLVSYIACSSSYSGGLHLYFPFQQAQSSWELASVVGTLLENGGFVLKPGQLELFPNPKPYSVEGALSLFNAHRLPMQIGSYLLNQGFQPIWGDRQRFVQQWKLAQDRNLVETTAIKRILKQAKRKHYCISGKADKFINDLNTEIELGWTGSGQTNYLLGRITMRAYIFHHILEGGVPLEGAALIEEIVNTARALPGYSEWCQHQHEIKHRAEEWARCIENSRYFHYGDPKGKYKGKSGESESELQPAIAGLPTWNQQQRESARERIRSAIVDLLEKHSLPAGATSRFRALTQYGIGGGSLYRHRDLWHPHYLVEIPPLPPNTSDNCQLDCAEGTSSCSIPTSLLATSDGDNLSSVGFDDRSFSTLDSTGGNPGLNQDTDCSITSSSLDLLSAPAPDSSHGLDFQSWSAVNRQAWREAGQRSQQIKEEAQQQQYIHRMQQYLHSGDPILMAEATAWAQINPGVLQSDRIDLPIFPHSQAMDYLFFPSLAPDPLDLSNLLVAISVELRRLGWFSTQTSSCLEQLFGKSRQALLEPMELVQWLDWLVQQESAY